jgi:phage tail sheath protein FI
MALYLSPLVDINEVDLTTTIPAVATSIGCIVIKDPWKGPELKRQLITNVEELIDTFGEPTSASYRDIISAYGYLKYGTKLYATAAFSPSATFAGVHGTLASAASGVNWQGYDIADQSAYQLTDFDSEDPDKFGDETIVFSSGRSDQNSEIAFIAATRGKHGNYMKLAMVGKTVYDDVRKGIKTYTEIGISQDLYNDVSAVDVSFDSSSDTEFLILVQVASQTEAAKTTPTYTVKEAWLVSTNDRKLDDEGQNLFCENFLEQNSKYIRCALNSSALNTTLNAAYTADYIQFSGGQNASATTSEGNWNSQIIAAYDIYEDPETIDINLLIDSDKTSTVKSNLISIAEDRKDAMAVLDVPQSMVVNNRGNEATDLRDYRLGLNAEDTLNENTSYAALYGNWLEVYDKWNARYRWVPAAGFAAGIYANTDDVSDPWFAPAGLNRAVLTNIRKLAFNPNQARRDILYKNGINPIVSFAGQGKVIWGQKTMLDKNSAFNRVSVRRLFIILEKAIATAVKYFLFEPNDTFTRLQLINMITPFLRDVQSRRGIYDFLVVCDSTNNTAERIDRNELWCDIYIKPTKAAEFIVLNFIATKTGASFTELVAAGQTPTSGI